MPISLTCSCGARLEIDDKFAGQVIPCPDCQKPLNTTPEPAERDVPVSGLALTSLILALVGAVTVVGSVAAVVVGYLAQRQIARAPDKVAGLNFARAGMILGGVFTLLTLGALLSSEVLGVDALLREYLYAGELDYNADAGGFYRVTRSKDDPVGLQRPSAAWAKLKPPPNQKDLLTLVNLWEDAHLVCLEVREETVQAAKEKAAEVFRGSDLYHTLSRGAHEPSPEPEAKPVPNSDDLSLDVRLGGYERTFLLRVVKLGPDLYLLAGGARHNRFPRVAGELRKSFDSFKRLEN